MRHDTAQLYLQPGSDAAPLQAALERLGGCAAANLPGGYGAGDWTWDGGTAAGGSVEQQRAQLQALPGVARVDHVRYEPLGGGRRAPQLASAIKRTLFLRVRPQAPSADVAQLECELLRMPQYLAGIRNWSLGRVVCDSPWTHVWQQEFERVDALLGEYMLHPYHWAWVDRWFDPEQPRRIVELNLSHAFCPIGRSVLAALTPSSTETPA